MHPMEHIRRNVLGVTQSELAEIAKVNQGTVSRWENGDAEPRREELERIRNAVLAKGLPWDSDWFFHIPDSAEVVEVAR